MIREGTTATSPKAISDFLAVGPECKGVVFETGRMAPMLDHGLVELSISVQCIENRQAYQVSKSLARHKADRNDACGLAHLARIGFYNPTHVKSLTAHADRSLIAARNKLVGQRVTIDNQIRGLVVVFGVRLPRALSPAFKDAALAVSVGVLSLHAALCGLFAAREAILTAVAAIDGDIKKMTRRSKVCQRLMTVPGVGPITALAFTAAIDDPHRFKKSRDVGADLGLVPQRHQSGYIDYTGSISKRSDVKVRTLLYEAANVMLIRYAAPLKLKSRALVIAARSTMRKARVALARRPAITLRAIMRDQTDFKAA